MEHPTDPSAASPTAAALKVAEKAAALAAVLARREPRCTQDDARQHFAFLAHALEFARPELFARYAAWAKPTLAHRGVPAAAAARQLHAMTLVAEEMLPAAEARCAAQYVRAALTGFADLPDSLEGSLGTLPDDARAYLERLLENDTDGARAVARRCMDGGRGLARLYTEVLAPAMTEVGLLWQCNRIGVAQEHYCAGVTQMVMGEAGATLRRVSGGRTAVVACVAGEQHSLGSRMVADFLDMTGWRTLWLGASTPGADILRMVVDHRADILALSCSHAPCLHDVATLVTALRVLPECGHVKVLVGGYAFETCEGLWRAVGADGFARDAAAAAQAAHRLVAAIG